MVKKIKCFFNRIEQEIRRICAKNLLIFALIFLGIGIFSWMVGGRADRVTFFYIFPRCAIPTVYMFILWGGSFVFTGASFGGILFGSEKYKKAKVYKLSIFFIIMQVFTWITYPLFFGTCSPLLTFFAFLIAEIFCFLAILDCLQLYSLYSLFLIFHFMWLFYNGFCALAFSFIN